jgi:large subunit ribosomal protein L10
LPSKVILEKKKKFVSDLVEKIKNSNIGILVSYKGINVENDTKLRQEMRQSGFEYFVVKNSMLRFAAKEVGYDFGDNLKETTAIALSKEDPILISKIITKYVKELKDKTNFFIKIGFLEGEVVGADVINELGTLPTKEELIGRLLGLLTYPMRSLAVAIQGIADKQESESKEA